MAVGQPKWFFLVGCCVLHLLLPHLLGIVLSPPFVKQRERQQTINCIRISQETIFFPLGPACMAKITVSKTRIKSTSSLLTFLFPERERRRR